MMLHNPGRHAVVTYASKDQSRTWRRSNVIDLGGIGHHDAAIEASFGGFRVRLWENDFIKE